MARPYIFKCAVFVVDQEELEEIAEFLDIQKVPFGRKELCDSADEYIEFDVPDLEDFNVPVIGNVKELGVDIVQVWNNN